MDFRSLSLARFKMLLREALHVRDREEWEIKALGEGLSFVTVIVRFMETRVKETQLRISINDCQWPRKLRAQEFREALPVELALLRGGNMAALMTSRRLSAVDGVYSLYENNAQGTAMLITP